MEERGLSLVAHEVSFAYWGQVPAKSNYRHSKSRKSKAQWAKIKRFEDDIADLALEAWVKSRNGRRGMKNLPHPITVTIEPISQLQDANNLSKIVLDGLEGTCYVNDKDVGCDIKPMKRDRKGGRIYVTVRWGK